MNRRSASNLRLLLAGTILLPAPAVITAAPSPGASDSLSAKVASSVKSVAARKSAAVLRVRCRDSHGELNGTGFLLDPSGTVCTLAELVMGGGVITVRQGAKDYPATLVAADPRSGVAFLKIDTSSPTLGESFLPPRSLTNAPALTPVLGLGIPRDEKPLLSLGMITGTQTHEGERYFCVPHLTAGLPLSEGEAGSPVLDLSGNLLGMVVSGNQASCRILPSGAIEKLHRDFLRFGRINPGWVGAVVEEAAVPSGNSRTRVAAVELESPAASAGLRDGDMILSIGGKAIREPDEVLGTSFYLSGGETVKMTVMRGTEVRSVEFRCGGAPTTGVLTTVPQEPQPTASLAHP